MHTYYYPGDLMAGIIGGLGIGSLFLCLVLAVCAIVAYFMAISSLVKTARDKGSQLGSGTLWFIGIFTTPIILGLIVIAQPDRR